MFTRIGRFFKAIFNAILGEAEAQIPVSMLEQSVREMLDNLRSLREATATTIAFETKSKRDLDAQNARLKKLARRALQLQVEAKATRERADSTHKAAKARADNARTKLKIEEERVEGKIRQLGELKSINAMNDAQKRMQAITDEYNIDGAVSVFDKTAESIQSQADKLSAMDTIAVSEGEDLDRQLSAISKKTEVDDALEALKARLSESPTTSSSGPAKEKEKISSAFEEK
jgi:phage shock protein A